MGPRSAISRPLGGVVNVRLNATLIAIKSTWDVIRPALDFWIVLVFTLSIVNGFLFLATLDWDKLLIAILLAYMWMRELDDNLEKIDEVAP